MTNRSFASKVPSSPSRKYLVRVGSCDFVDRPCFLDQRERSTKPHELNTKLVTIEIDLLRQSYESLSDLERGEIRGRPTTAQDALNSTGFTSHRLHRSFNSRLCTMLLSMPARYTK